MEARNDRSGPREILPEDSGVQMSDLYKDGARCVGEHRPTRIEGGRQESTARAASPLLVLGCVSLALSHCPSILSCFVSCFNALQAADAPHHGHLTSLVAATAAYVCVCALYVGFVHPHALLSLSFSVSLSVCRSIFLRAYHRGSLFVRCCWLARLASAAVAA